MRTVCLIAVQFGAAQSITRYGERWCGWGGVVGRRGERARCSIMTNGTRSCQLPEFVYFCVLVTYGAVQCGVTG